MPVPKVTVIMAQSWDDSKVSQLLDDCMLSIAQGVYFHHRLQSVIMIRMELPQTVANSLPWG